MKVKKIGIVSLSSGILGEKFIQHEVKIGLKRLAELGVEVAFLPHALKGLDYLKNHPEKRGADLLAAFQDDSLDIILCAIGGEDTYRLLPYLFDNQQLQNAVTDKIFLGFSDTTMNHFMLHKVGLKTFYGQAFLPDICELAPEMLPYTKHYFTELLETGTIKAIYPSDNWYEERTDFSEKAVGTSMKSHPNQGFQLLQGKPKFQGEILGGCLDSIYDLFNHDRFADTVAMGEKYHLFPDLKEWQGKILLLETSEEKPHPELFRKMIRALKDFGIFQMISGLLVGKPQDETYYEEYQQILLEEIANPKLPIVYNLNIGHATPRCIIPFGVLAKVDVTKQIIEFGED